MRQIAATVPYMVSVGNHENSPAALAHFTESFRNMPSNSGTISSINGQSRNNWWYSWNSGLVHYVAISTELYFGINGVGESNSCATQFKWLEADLKRANQNRDKQPWIVVHGHRSIYCSCDGDCDGAAETVRDGTKTCGGLEELLFQNGVDFFMNGHEHDYERMWPTYKGKTDSSNVDPKATVYVVTGAAGCSEMHEPFTRPQPPRSAFRANVFGYNRMYVHNATHIHWQYIATDPTYFKVQYGTVIDDTWFVQHHHGPFSLERAPRTQPFCGSRRTVDGRATEPRPCGRQYDHWADHVDNATGRVSIPAGSVWHRLKHDRPVPLSVSEEHELLDSFNSWQRKKDQKQEQATAPTAATQQTTEGAKDDMVWEDLSDARRRYML
jgi:hypothetical protein